MYGLRLWASVVLFGALIERNNRFFDQCWVAELVAIETTSVRFVSQLTELPSLTIGPETHSYQPVHTLSHATIQISHADKRIPKITIVLRDFYFDRFILKS
jgi:hypothetical protein